MEKQFWIIVDIELGQAVCSKKTGKTLTFKSEQDAHYEISVGLLSSLDEYMAIEVKTATPDEVLRTASDKTKSEVFQTMTAEKAFIGAKLHNAKYHPLPDVTEKEQILNKFINLINEREPKIRAIVKELEPAITFPNGKGERLMRLLIGPADVREIIGIPYTPGVSVVVEGIEPLTGKEAISPMPDWDMEAEFAKLLGIPESRQGHPTERPPKDLSADITIHKTFYEGYELPKQLEIGMVAITKYGEVVEITQDDMPGYPYDCFIRLATPTEIEMLKPKKPKMSETERINAFLKRPSVKDIFDDTNNPES
jgi:hypothetical protein